MNSASDVIEALAAPYGSVSALARELGQTPQTVFNWRYRDRIPLQYNSELLVLARRNGIEVTRAQLEAFNIGD